MVKNKKNLSFGELPKTLFNFKVFENNITTHSLILYSALLIIISAGINMIKSVQNYTAFEAFEAFVITLIGTPIILLVVYSLFYLFLRAFDPQTSSFFDGFLVFVAVTMPFILIGHIVNWIRFTFESLTYILGLLLVLFIIYYAVNMVLHMKTFFKTTKIRILVSFLFVDIIFVVVGTAQYLFYLIANLR